MSVGPPEVAPLNLKPETLERLAQDFVRLLKSVDSCGFNLYEGPALQRAIWRYETMWLPLVGALSLVLAQSCQEEIDTTSIPQHMRERVRILSHRLRYYEDLSDLEVVPPLDVAWVWYVHRLSVELYLHDVTSVVGKPIAPTADSAFRYGTSNRSSQAKLWRIAYSRQAMVDDFHDCTDAAFLEYFPPYLRSLVNGRGKVVARQAAVGSVSGKNYSSAFKYDIAEGVRYHRGVLWLYMRNHDLSRMYIQAAVARYKSFLELKCRNPGVILEPSEDIDFIWRVHIAALASYLSDDLVAEALDPSICMIENASSRALDNLYSHIEAVQVRNKRPVTAADRRKLLVETADAWTAAFGDTRGEYLIQSHVPRMVPRGKRDGYLQDILRNSASTSARSSSSEPETDTDSGSDDNMILASWAQHAFPATQSTPSSHARSGRCTDMQKEHGTPAVTGESATIPFAPSRTGLPEASRLNPKQLRFNSVGPIAADDVDLDRDEGATERKRRKSEMKKRLEEERQIRKDLQVRQSHGLKSASTKKSAAKTFSNLQVGRAILLGFLGAVLFISGSVVMSNKEETTTSTIGVGIFFGGLFCFLLATALLGRPEAAERARVKAEAALANEQRAEENREAQEAKAEKKAFFRTIQEISFAGTEEQIVIGGGDEVLRFSWNQVL